MHRFASLILPIFAGALCACGDEQTREPARAEPAVTQIADRSEGARAAPISSPMSLPETSPPPADPAPAPSPEASVAITGPGRPSPQPLPAKEAILPLARILQIATTAVPGEVIEVDLDNDDDDDDGPEYELEILTGKGRTIEMKIDARRGRILEMEED